MEIYPVPVTLAGTAGLQQPKHHGPSCLLGSSQQLLRSSRSIPLLTSPFKSHLSKHSMHARTRTQTQAARLQAAQILYFNSGWAPGSLLVSFSKGTGVARESAAMPRVRAWGLLLGTVLPVSHRRLPARGPQRAES